MDAETVEQRERLGKQSGAGRPAHCGAQVRPQLVETDDRVALALPLAERDVLVLAHCDVARMAQASEVALARPVEQFGGVGA